MITHGTGTYAGAMTDIVLLTAGPDSVFALDYALSKTNENIIAVHVFTGTRYLGD
jgi:7-cyano-7-deazaguanine synthase in queuosine biosynthesis